MSTNDCSDVNNEKSSFLNSQLSDAEVEESSLNLNNNFEFSNLEVSSQNDSTTPIISSFSVTLEQHEQMLLEHPERLLANGHTTTIDKHGEESKSVNETTLEFDEGSAAQMSLEVNDCPTAEIVNRKTDLNVQTLEEEPTEEQSEQLAVGEVQENNECHTLDVPMHGDSTYFQNALVELGRRLWPSAPTAQQYTKGCLWSPDGTCLLTSVHLDGMHVIELPTDLYTLSSISTKDCQRAVSKLNSAVRVREGGTVYDFVWYPFMQSNSPETCCWLATRQHEPIHMWDAFTGELRCSYRGYDDVDEVESAISLCFSNDGQKILGGYKKSIKVFDTNIPGRGCVTLPVKQAVSCFALMSDSDQTVTTGTWNGYVQHYDLRSPKLGSLFTLGGHSGGITCLRYISSSAGGWLLFSGARRDNKLLLWDMRNYAKPLREFQRIVNTNQRIYFDLSPQQQWLASGNTDGMLRLWNLLDAQEQEFMLPLHSDCCNGVNFHPTLPVLATSSGQYHFVDITEENEITEEKIVNYENSLLLFWCGPNTE